MLTLNSLQFLADKMGMKALILLAVCMVLGISTAHAGNACQTMEEDIKAIEADATLGSREKDTRIEEIKTRCKIAESNCNKLNNGVKDKIAKWDPDLQECIDLKADAQDLPASGECDHAELLRGTNLKGEACKDTADTIRDVAGQQEALMATTTAATTAYTGMQAMDATGSQADSQKRQQNVFQALALSKIATGGANLAGAAQLKSAASDAEASSSSISTAHTNLMDICSKEKVLSSEQCFYKNSESVGITGTAQEYANFERLRMAAEQSKEQAEIANNMAIGAGITGLADTLVGLQAMQMARRANKNSQNMGALPPAYNLNTGASGGMGTIGGGAGTGETPTDYGLPSDGGGLLDVASGGVGNSIKGGKGFATSGTFKPEKSSVSTASGGGGGGGGKGSGGGSNPGGKNNRGPYGEGKDQYSLGGGGGGAGGSGRGGEKADGTNPFAEALAKLFPPDQAGKPVVDARGLASTGAPIADSEQGSEVYASDLSIFEQITAKYRLLANAGRL